MTKTVTLRKDFVVSGPAAWAARPALSSLMSAIVVLWAMAEHNIAMMFVLLVDGNAEDTLDVFHEFFDFSPRKRIILVLARKKLSNGLYRKVESVLESMRKMSKVRNAIVHGLWAASDEFPNALLEVDEKHFNRMFLQRMRRAKDGDRQELPDGYEYQGMTLCAYEEKDFRLNIDKLNDLSSLTHVLAVKMTVEIVDATKPKRSPQ